MNVEWAYVHFFMFCNFFHTNKKYFVFEKFAIKKQTAVLFFFCSSVYWTWVLDWCTGAAKKWWWVNKAWQVWFLWCLLLLRSSFVARPSICFFLVYGSSLKRARTMIPFFAFRQITTDWLVFKIVWALVLDFNHNYNKIVKSDWLSTALISALIGQFNRTVHVICLSNWTVCAITHALKWLFFSLLAKQNFEFLMFWFKR